MPLLFIEPQYLFERGEIEIAETFPCLRAMLPNFLFFTWSALSWCSRLALRGVSTPGSPSPVRFSTHPAFAFHLPPHKLPLPQGAESLSQVTRRTLRHLLNRSWSGRQRSASHLSITHKKARNASIIQVMGQMTFRPTFCYRHCKLASEERLVSFFMYWKTNKRCHI